MDKKLNLMAPIGTTGYGVAGYNLANSLLNQDWELALFLKGKVDTAKKVSSKLEGAIKQSQLFFRDSPCLNIWHQFDLANRVGKGPYYAMPIFELDRFTDIERHHLAYPDKIIVNSEWAKGVLINNLVRAEEDIHVVPLGVDPALFYPSFSSASTNKTIFLNCGKWEVRKGHDVLYEAFNKAFDNSDNVELWMMCHNGFLSPQDNSKWEDLYLDSSLGKQGKIKIIPWQNTQEDVVNVMRKTHCGVFPSRAEGWNLEALEMMALGKHLIITNCTAHSEFCNHSNSKLIQIDEKEPAYDGKWFFEQGNWSKLGKNQINQLISHMRDVHQQVQSSPGKDNEGGLATAKIFTWENAARKLSKILLDN